MHNRPKLMNQNSHWLKEYFSCHLRDLLSSLGELSRQPFSSLMILLVIGISLALPLSFLVLLKNVTQFTDNLKGQSQITLFLKMDATKESAEKLKIMLTAKPEIAKIDIIAPDTALAELMKTLNIQDAIQSLPNNPLPFVLILSLSKDLGEDLENAKQIESLLAEAQSLPEVEKASLDLLWVKRLAMALHFAQQLVTAIALLLSFAILLVIGNTLGLYIENHREHIEISKLIGATDAFVRRPFLYLGVWFGFLGSLFAMALVFILMFYLGQAAKPLLESYHSHWTLNSMDLQTSLSLLLLGILLGFGAAWLSVSRHLRQLKPRYT